MNRISLSLLSLLCSTVVIADPFDWCMFGRDATHAAASSSIAPCDLNAATLGTSAMLGIKPGSSPAVVDGRAYVYAEGSPAGILYCLNATTMAIIWSNTVAVDDTGWGSWASPAVADGLVVFGAESFLGCWTTNGAPQWTAAITPAMNSSPMISDGRVFVGSFHYANATNTLAAYSLSAGTQLWINTDVPTAFSSCSPVIDYSQGIGYACCGSDVWSFRCDTGSNLWRVTLPCTSLKNVSIAADTLFAVNHDVFASGPQTNLVALDAANGSVRWTQMCGGSEVPPAIWGSTAVHSCGDSATPMALTAYDIPSGSQLWTRTDVGNSGNMPAIANGIVYAAAGVYDGWTYLCMSNLSAVNVADGTLLSRRGTTEGGSAPAITRDVLFSANNGRLYRYSWTPTLTKLSAKVEIARGVKDSLSFAASIPAGPAFTNLAPMPMSIVCGGVTLFTNTVGVVKTSKSGVTWQYKAGTLSVKMKWTASKETIAVNAKVTKTTLEGKLPCSSTDGTVTNAVLTTLWADKNICIMRSENQVPATTKKGKATLKYKQ